MADPIEHQSIYDGGHTDWRPGLSCDECGERAAQAAARFPKAQGNSRNPEAVAYGTGSLSPKVDEFWHTGDPEVFSRP